MTKIVPFLLAASLVAAPALADPLLHEDFQSGKADGWLARGAGDVRVTQYLANFSLRLKGKAEAVRPFSAKARKDVAVSADIAAEGLGPRDACLVEASSDRGAHWIEVGKVGHGEDDAVTTHRRRAVLPALSGAEGAVVRLRADLGSDAASCWFDDVRVEGAIDDPAELRPLDAAFLAGAAPLAAPRDLSVFAPARAFAPGAPLEGVLSLTPDSAGGGARVVQDDGNVSGRSGSFKVPPPLSIPLVSEGGALIPAVRGPIRADHPDWEWIVEPGVTWTDPADGGWSRAALPFAFQERNANCTHNGVLTFLYRADGTTTRAAWEVASETCAYFKVDLWGVAPTRLRTGPVPGRAALVDAWRREVAARLPTRPVEEIGQVYPGVAAGRIGSPLEVDPEDMTAFGFLAGGIHWVGGCRTRHGAYPFCDVLDLPSYSVSKSIFASLALMRLQLLWPGAKDERIGAHLPGCGESKWGDVTFENAIDMATGNYDRLGYDVDEGAPKMNPFFLADSHSGRERLACGMFPRRTPPGRQWVYHTIDTYLLGAAMQDFLRRRLGPSADIHRDLIVDPLWRPLGLSPVTFTTRRSYDAAAQPFTGWGLTLHRDDIVRIARFVAGGAIIDGKPAVDPKMLAAALQRDPADPGLEAGAPDQRYKNGYWAWNIARAIGCGHPVWVPFMSGYGGITVAMFPNGVVYYYFSDGRDYSWRSAAEAADRVQPMCGR